MKLQQLRTFVAVAEHRSIRGAARALFVSQSAVTRTIRELEIDLDVPLVHRSISGIELTDAGVAFQARANLLLEEMRRAREELLFMKAGWQGHVAVAMTSTVGLTLLPGALEAFLQRMPQAKVSITEDAGDIALRKLQDGTLDFFVANSAGDDLPQEFSQQPLFTMQLVVGARNGHPLSAARSIRELKDQFWLVPSLNRDVFARLFVANGLSIPSRILECESFALGAHLLGRSDMLTLFSAALFEQELRSRGIRALSLHEDLPLVDVSIVTLRKSRLTPTAQCLIDCLLTRPLLTGMLPPRT
jgi:LysR family transcriptional regulator, regulator of abg operon